MLQVALIIAVFVVVGWRYGAMLVLRVWLAGWLLFLLHALILNWLNRRDREHPSWFFGRNTSDADLRGYLLGVVLRLILSLICWPFFLIGLLGEYCEDWLPRIAVRLGLRPAWSLPSGADGSNHTWKLQDGTEVSASALGLGKDEPAEISVDMENGTAEYRVRRVAPEPLPATKWRLMKRLSPEEYADQTEEEEDLHATPPFESKLKLEPGKYVVEFRVENAEGQLEELSGLALVVY